MMRFVLSSMALLLLAGCGVSGGLDRPAPMWGRAEAETADQARQERECRRLHRQCPASTSAPPASSEPSPNQPPGGATAPQ